MAAHRFWRLKYDASPRGYCSCATLQLRDINGGADVTQGAGGNPIAGSAYPGYGQGNAFDNDGSTFWSSGGGADYIGYDFGAGVSHDIHEVVYYPRPDGYDNNDAPSSGGIEWSDDGANWTRALAFANQSGYSANTPHVFTVSTGGPAAGATASGLAIVVPLRETAAPAGGANALQLAVVVPTREVPPKSGGATVSGAAIVAVQIEYKQPYRNQQLPLIVGPMAFPLFIARGSKVK